MNTFNIKVDSKLHRNPDFLEITSGLDFGISEIANETTKKIVQFEDEAIKNALKELGWLSPEEAEILFQAASCLSEFKEGTTHYKQANQDLNYLFSKWMERCKK
jgi:hypothetical protein